MPRRAFVGPQFLLRLAGQAVSPPASGTGLLRRSARRPRSGRHHPSNVSLRSGRLRSRRHRGLRHRLGRRRGQRAPPGRRPSTACGGAELSYWHIAPAVRPGQRVVAYRTLIGRIEPGWGHVHLAEMHGGAYVNPLRPGGMGPYVDRTCPSVKQIRFERAGDRDEDSRRARRPRSGGRRLRSSCAVGACSVEGHAGHADADPLAHPDRGRARRPPLGDRRRHPSHPPDGGFETVYATRTRQNRPNRPGTYRFYLARGWNSSSLRDGDYTIEVELSDSRGNRSRSSRAFTIAS